MNDLPWLLFLRLGMVALLYIFLIQVVWLLRRSLAADSRPTRSGATARLVVVESSGPHLTRGHAFALRDVTSIGRSTSSAIRVEDPYASAEHALVTLRDGRAWLEDLGSTNGTFLNRRQIAKPTLLQSGDIVQVGQVKFKFLS
ncbi:MAG: FHA domain-containing protein [Chloroflexi bacterium]|nr:FHA domain-containing protein [Chloroflexota bacterium]MCL5108338.1 FHA domain-containing protein [Chloroflexota bacterium]